MTLQELIERVAKWDFYYRATEDPRIFDEGDKEEKALIEGFKTLSEQDRHIFQKLAYFEYVAQRMD